MVVARNGDVADGNLPVESASPVDMLPANASKVVQTALETIAAAAVAAKPTAGNQAVAFIMGEAADANLPLVAAATDDAQPSDTAAS